MSRSADAVTVVESAYALEGEMRSWLGGVLSAAQPLLDRGHGVLGYAFDWRFGQVDALVTRGGQEWGLDATARVLNAMPPEMVARTYLSPRVCGTASEMTGLGAKLAAFEPWTRVADPVGMVDSIGIKVDGPTAGQGVMLHAVLDRVSTTTRLERQRWGRIAAHLSAGLRLRAALAQSLDSRQGEAVLRADGRVVHAEDRACPRGRRAALREAVRRREVARGGLRRRDPERALALWRGLAAGRWTLIDHYEEGGRHYVVAHRNEPVHTGPEGLTPRERQVVQLVARGRSNKLIAYTLGLSLSTVGTHIARARIKLGVTSRVQLMAAVAAWGAEDSSAEHP